MARKPTGRPPGAPPNNINHLKHGLYSHRISVKNDEDLDVTGHEESSMSTDIRKAGGFEFDSFRSRDAVTLRIRASDRARRPQDAVAHFGDKTEGAGVLPARRSIQLDSPKDTFPPNLVNSGSPCAFLLDVAGHEESSMSTDIRKAGGFEFDSFRSCDAVTLRIRARWPQATIAHSDDTSRRSMRQESPKHTI